MPTLADIRAKLPDLEGLDDEQAISVIQQVYYPTVPVEQIAARLGYKPASSAALPERTKLAAVGDTAIETVNAAIGGIGSIGSFVAPGNPVSEFIDAGIVKPLQERQSDRKKAINARLAQDIAGAQGIGDQVGAALRYAKDDPAGLLGMAAGSFAIPLGAIKGAGMLAKSLGVVDGAATKAALAGGALTGAALSGGDAAGQAYEESLKAGATEEQAQAAARQASVIPAIVGGAGGMLPGAERIVAGAKGFAGNAISRALKTGASEGAQEFGEEFATQYEANRAVAPYDGRDPMQGAVAAGTLGALAGGHIGAVTGAMSPARVDEPAKPKTPEQKAAKVLAAGSVDEAIKAAQDATIGKPAGGGLDRLRGILPDEQRREVIGLMATANNPNSPPNVRRFAEQQIDAILREYTDIPTADVLDEAEMLPTPDATELTDEERAAYVNAPSNLDRLRLRKPIPTGEATDAIPAADAQEIEPIPAGDASEEIPAPNAYEVPPVGEASEVIPTGDAMEVPRIPTGKATEIEPEVVEPTDLTTTDGMPYGSKTAANVRARREGLGPANVIEIPGAGWVVRPQPKTLGPAPIQAQPAGTRGTNAGDVVKRAESTVPAQPTEGPGSDAGNGFKQGPKKGERYRVGVVAAAGGAVTLEKRYPAGTAATFYVGKDGNLIDGDSVNFIGDGRSALWIPPTPELAQQAQQILDEMGRLELTDPARKDAKARLKALVLQSGANPNAKAPDAPNPARPAGPRPADPGRSDGAGVLPVVQPGDVAGGAAAPAGQGVAGGGAAGPGGRGGALTRYQEPNVKRIGDDWQGYNSREWKPDARQQVVMDAVAAALDSGLFYSRELKDRVATDLGVSDEVRAKNRSNVEGGDFGYDVYYARKAVEARRELQSLDRETERASFKAGDKLGVLVFSDYKATKAVVVETVEDGLVTFTGKRGNVTVRGKANALQLKAAMDRAKERGNRLDDFDAFVAGRSKAAPTPNAAAPAEQATEQSRVPEAAAPAQQNLQDRLSDARRIGKEAAERGDPRDPPEAFTGMEKQVWRAGWDQGRKIGGPTPQVPALPAAEKPRKTLQEARTDAALDRQVRENGEITTRRQWVERKVAEGLKTRITQEDRIKPMSRMQFFRANNEEQRAHERKIKEAGKKDVYWIGDYEVTKIEHDYAARLTAAQAAPPPANEAPTPNAAAPAEKAPEQSRVPEAAAPALDSEPRGGVLPPGFRGLTWRQAIDKIVADHGRNAYVDGASIMYPSGRKGQMDGIGNVPADVVQYAAEALKPKPAVTGADWWDEQEADPFEAEKLNLTRIKEISQRQALDLDTDHMRSDGLAATGWSAESAQNAAEAMVPPIVREMVGAATASAAALRERVTDVRYAPTDGATNNITFKFDGKPMIGELRGRNADAVLRGKDAEGDRALAVRVLLDGDATPAAAPTLSERVKQRRGEKAAAVPALAGIRGVEQQGAAADRMRKAQEAGSTWAIGIPGKAPEYEAPNQRDAEAFITPSMRKQGFVAYPMTKSAPPAEATHKDPGQPAEPATAPVIAQALSKAAVKEALSRSAMKADLLRMIDAAVLEAPDIADFDAAVKSMGRKDAVAVFTDAKGTLGEKSAPARYSRPTRTFKVEGDGTFTVNNTVRQLLTFRAKVESSPGFRDQRAAGIPAERATDALDRRATDAVIANMVDEGDFQAALDFAEAKGVDISNVKLTKLLRERLEKWQKDQESAKRMAEWRAAQEEGKPAPGSLSAAFAEKESEAAPAPAAEPVADEIPEAGVASQTFDQWVRAKYNGNEYKDKYLEAFDGNEKRAMLGAAVSTIDNDRHSADLLKAARAKYMGELLDLPRDTSISLEVWDSLDNMAKVESQRHFFDLDSRITRRTQDQTRARVEAEKAKKAPYEAAFAEVDAEIRRLDKLPGPITKKQNELSARRDRLREAIYQIGQGKEPDGRLLRAPQPEVDAAPAAEPVAEAPALPNPWEISQDEFVSRVTFTKEGSSAFPWVAKWGDRILEAENEVFDHPDLGKTVVQGGRFSKTKREAEVVARGAHKRAVRRGVLNGNKATPEALAAYPDLLPAEAPAPERDERTIELRKRASVLRSLRECLG